MKSGSFFFNHRTHFFFLLSRQVLQNDDKGILQHGGRKAPCCLFPSLELGRNLSLSKLHIDMPRPVFASTQKIGKRLQTRPDHPQRNRGYVETAVTSVTTISTCLSPLYFTGGETSTARCACRGSQDSTSTGGIDPIPNTIEQKRRPETRCLPSRASSSQRSTPPAPPTNTTRPRMGERELQQQATYILRSLSFSPTCTHTKVRSKQTSISRTRHGCDKKKQTRKSISKKNDIKDPSTTYYAGRPKHVTRPSPAACIATNCLCCLAHVYSVSCLYSIRTNCAMSGIPPWSYLCNTRTQPPNDQ